MPHIVIPENSDYDISRSGDAILESLRYMLKGNEYELVLQLRSAKALASMIPEPSLDLPVTAGPASVNVFTEEAWETGDGLQYLYSLVSDPEIAVKIVLYSGIISAKSKQTPERSENNVVFQSIGFPINIKK